MRFDDTERAVEYLEAEVRVLFAELSKLKDENFNLWNKLKVLERTVGED